MISQPPSVGTAANEEENTRSPATVSIILCCDESSHEVSTTHPCTRGSGIRCIARFWFTRNSAAERTDRRRLAMAALFCCATCPGKTTGIEVFSNVLRTVPILEVLVLELENEGENPTS